MKMNYTHLILLLVVTCIVMPVSADEGNITSTTSPSMNETTVVTTSTTVVPTATTTTLVANITTTAVPATTATTVPATTAIVTTTQATVASTGDLSVASSPLGAAILIDGTYYGVTPGNVTGISPGNHMLRISLSGYNDYEGTVYVIAGQSIPAYGTLHPISGGTSQIIVATASAQPTIVPPETTAQPTATQTTSDSALASPTVIAALIGIITAAIGAGATIFTHNANKAKAEIAEEKAKKDGKE